MIEFNGSYFQYSTSDALSVLVQFDGTELHVWHVPEPFFRLAAFDTFRVTVRKGSHRSINLPNGARIDTTDDIADKLIGNHSKWMRRYLKKKPWALALLALLAVSACYWLLSSDIGFIGSLK